MMRSWVIDESKKESLNYPTFKQDVASSFLIVDWSESKATSFFFLSKHGQLAEESLNNSGREMCLNRFESQPTWTTQHNGFELSGAGMEKAARR